MKRATIATLLACACAGKSPIPTGDKPAWVSTPNGDVRFPADRFIAAVGSTTVGSKRGPELVASVDAAARAAVASSLTSAIAGQGGNLDSVTPLLDDIQIEGRWRDERDAYAWAVFDKGKALAVEQARFGEHEKLWRDALAQGDGLQTEKPGDALGAYARARSEALLASASVPMVRALGGKADPLPATEAERKVAALLGELVLNVVEGDQQRVAEGAPLPSPIVFSAWVKGKRAAGLPMAVTIDGGGRAPPVTVGPDGKGEVHVESIGKFSKPEQQIRIAVDWKAIAGEVPAWAPKAEVAAVAFRKGVDTTRVLVLVAEKVEGSAATGAPAAEKIAASLKAAGFNDVQTGQALLAKFGADRIAKMTDEQIREAARRVADVVVFGSAASRGTVARGHIRAIDVVSGAVMWEAPSDEVKAGSAGKSALEALGDAYGPPLSAALKKSETP